MAHMSQSSYTPAPSVTAVLALIVAWFALLAAFYLHPSFDVEVSSFFFTGPLCEAALPDFVCGYFPLRRLQAVEQVRQMLYMLPYAAAALIVALGAAGVFSRDLRRHLPMGRLLVALISLCVGPGLIVNGLLKSYSGRPRPVQTNLFGGPFDFTAAGTFVGECAKNCSFVSGEASGAGWLLCLLFLFPVRMRVWVGPPLVATSLTMAGLRVAVGAHYASDALLGWLLAIILFMGLLVAEARLHEMLARSDR
jgi:membrane-associated phospholipid phosphatase